MNSTSKFATGIKYGVITGIVYVLLLLIRYMFCASTPFLFTGVMFVSYLVVIVFFVMAAKARKKELGGYAEIKELFQTVFVTILIAELFYTLFTYIYLNFIDPAFMERFMQNTVEYVKRIGGSEASIEAQVEKMKDQGEQQRSVTSMITGYAIWVVVDSIIGILIALALKKPRPTSEFDLDVK
jgi:NADH:ubiquinone oxidoreductase subunit 6 (subunit J)